MTKNTLLCLLGMIGLFFFSGCTPDDISEQEALEIIGVDFQPNYFIQDDQVTGIDFQVTEEVLSDVGIEYESRLADDWSAAYEEVSTGSNKVLLSVAYSESRKDDFKWVGPTSQAIYCVFTKTSSGIAMAQGVEGAKQLESIACVSGWLETSLLEEMGFTNLVLFDSYQEAYDAFMNDEVKTIASDGYQLAYEMGPGHFDEIITVFRYRTVFYYMAFSKNVSDVVIQTCQESLEDLIKTDKTYNIIKEYFPNVRKVDIPGTVQIFSEEAPPFNYFTRESYTSFSVDGVSSDIVNEVQDRLGYCDAINMANWVDCFETVQYLPNSAMYTVARTADREEMFQWVGPIAPIRACFYTLSDQGLVISSLDDAKALQSVGTPLGWYTHSYLMDNGFQNIVATAITAQDAFNQLINGEVESILMFDLGVSWMVKEFDLPDNSVQEQLEVSNDEGYIAFSKNTNSEIVQAWQDALDAMKDDGTFDEIWNSWF